MLATEARAGLSAPETAAAAPALALLEDHLNAVLRHGEALRGLERPRAESAFSGATVPAQLRRNRQADAIASDAHALELAIILRLRQAQVTAQAAKRQAGTAAPLLHLVAVAADLVADAMLGQPDTAERFRSPVAASGFLASRGVGADASETLGEAYLIGGKTPLGSVMDAAAAALDMLDHLVFRL